MSLKIDGLALTHEGRVRRNNEDNYYLFGTWREDVQMNRQTIRKTVHADRMLAAVYDGMGGEEAGEIASLIAAETFSPCLEEQILPEAGRQVQKANARICEKAAECGIERMGTTVAALYLDRDTAVSCNVGDSRCYFFRNGKLRQLSTDHSEAQRMIDMGVLDQEEARRSRGWHMLTQHLGIDPEELRIEPHFGDPVHIQPGDLFLLCSDGLTDLVMDDEIADILQSRKDIQAKAEELMQRALDQGGRDNITLVLLQAEDEESREEDRPDRGRKKNGMKRKAGMIAAAVIILVIAAVLAGLWISRGRVSAQVREQLNLGEQYLLEQEYEQAVVAFTEAIALDEKNVEAYLGLAEAYLGLQDEDAALAALRDGYTATKDARLQERIEELEGSVQGGTDKMTEDDRNKAESEAEEIAFTFALTDIQVMGYDLMSCSYDEIAAALMASFPSQIIPDWQEGSADTMWHSESDTWDSYTYETDLYRYELTLHDDRYLDYTVRSTAEYDWLSSLQYDEGLLGVYGKGIRLNTNLEVTDSLVLARDGMLEFPFELGITEEELKDALKVEEIKEKGFYLEDGEEYIFLDSSLGKGTFREEVINEDGRGSYYNLDIYPDAGGIFHISVETNGDGRVYDVLASYDPEEAYFYVPEELQGEV